MTNSTPPAAPGGPGTSQWFGHPRGLSTLFFTEMWERFSFYGMKAVLILFMTAAAAGANPGLGLTTAKAAAIYGLYTFFVYMLSLPGGWVADKLWGQKRAVFVGGVIIMMGHIALAIPYETSFFIGLALVVVGTGLLKPNVSSMVGDLYPEGGARRDAGFSVFYMGINLGSFLGVAAVGWLGEKHNFHWGFSLAAIGMFAGLVQYKLGARHLAGAGELKTDDSDDVLAARGRRFYGISAAAVGFVIVFGYLMHTGALSITINAVAAVLGASVALLAVVYFSQLILSTAATMMFIVVALVGAVGISTQIDAEPFIKEARASFASEAVSDAVIALRLEKTKLVEAGTLEAIPTEKELKADIWSTALAALTPEDLQGKLEGLRATKQQAVEEGALKAVPSDEELTAEVGMGEFKAAVPAEAADSRGTLDRNLRAYQYGIGLAVLLFLIICSIKCLNIPKGEDDEKKRLFVIFWLFLLVSIFWMGFEQAGSSMNLFGRDYTDRMVGNWELPASWLQNVNAFLIILLAPVFGLVWTWLARRNANPSIPVKFALGLLGLGTGFFVLSWGAANASDVEKVGMSWLIVTYFFHTVGELCISPVGLSSITKLAPPDRVGQMMGVWFIGAALGNLFAGLATASLGSQAPSALFRTVAIIVGITGIVALMSSPMVKRLTGDIQ